jgi:hypothetical protein
LTSIDVINEFTRKYVSYQFRNLFTFAVTGIFPSPLVRVIQILQWNNSVGFVSHATEIWTEYQSIKLAQGNDPADKSLRSRYLKGNSYSSTKMSGTFLNSFAGFSERQDA